MKRKNYKAAPKAKYKMYKLMGFFTRDKTLKIFNLNIKILYFLLERAVKFKPYLKPTQVDCV